MNIVFYGFAEREAYPSSSGWHFKPIIDIAKKFKNYKIYSVIQSSQKCYIVKDNLKEISKKSILKINPDLFVCRSYGELGVFDKLLSNSKKSIYLYSITKPSLGYLSRYTKIVCPKSIFKPVPDYDIFRKFKKKKKYISYVGSLFPRKNQIRFAQSLDPEITKEHPVFFSGKNKNPGYVDSLISTCKNRNIKYYIPKKFHIPHIDLYKIYRESACLILMSEEDDNPRCLIESILSNTPFIISKDVKINEEYEEFGIRSDFKNLNKNIRYIIDDFKMPEVTDNFMKKHSVEYYINNTLEIK